MLVTQHPALKKFWYPVARKSTIEESPINFTLLGEEIVIWKSGENSFGAARDKCPHRSAKLSKGHVKDGQISCPYHGWSFSNDGVCRDIPQLDHVPFKNKKCLTTYQCQEKYGYIWVCMSDEAISAIPLFPESLDEHYYQIHEFMDLWQCSGLRIMENGFDNAHFSYVHTGTFGTQDDVKPAPVNIQDASYGFDMDSIIHVKNPQLQKENLQILGDKTIRDMQQNWFLPFGRRMRLKYPTGLIHTIITWATPINDKQSLVLQFAFRNDLEENPDIEKIIQWDKSVTNEDKLVLETTDCNTPLDLQAELHMPSDLPGILMRKKISKILEKYDDLKKTENLNGSKRYDFNSPNWE